MIEEAIKRTKTQRAPGPDALPNELFRSNPSLAAKVLWPLAMKFATRLEEPLQFKGGQLVSLYKGKGQHSNCESFRGILLMANAGKIVRSAMRKHVNEPYVACPDELQLAGKPGISVTFGAQAVRSFHAIAKQRGYSSAILFCDIKAAYYMLLREISVGATTSDEDVAKIVARLGLGPEVMSTLAQAMSGVHAYANIGASPHQQALLRESLSDTWFTLFEEDFTQTSRGTRPGDSWADIVFNVTFHALLVQLQEELAHLPIWMPLPECQDKVLDSPMLDNGKPLAHVTWADDLAIPMIFETPQALVKHLPVVIDHLLRALEMRGMQAHIGKAKTAAIATPRGAGAISIRRQLFKKKEANLPVVREEQTVQVPLVSCYKHLGGQLTAKGDLLTEIKARMSRARSSYWRAAKTVFRNERLTKEARCQLFQATVMASFLWGAGCWPSLNQQEEHRYQTYCWELYAFLLPKSFRANKPHLSHAEVLDVIQLPHPTCLLHAARVRHFQLLVNKAPMPVWTLFRMDKIAVKGLEESLKWLRSMTERDAHMPDFGSLADVTTFINEKPGAWKAAIKRALRRAVAHQTAENKQQYWHQRLYQMLDKEGLVVTLPKPSPQANPCLLCEQGFGSKRAWFLHAHIKHSYLSMHGQVAEGQKCFVCAKEYTSRISLMAHLRYSPACCTQMWQKPLPPGPLTEEHPQAPWRYTGAEQEEPPVPVHRDFFDLTNELEQCIRCFSVDTDDPTFTQVLFESLKAVCTRVMHLADIVECFSEWAAEYRNSKDPKLTHALSQIDDWFVDCEKRLSLTSPDISVRQTEADRSEAQIRSAGPRFREFLPRQMICLHLFSGRRRPGDVQNAFESLPAPDGATILVVSVDVVVSQAKCNLLRTEQQTQWLKLALDGAIAAVIAGPPCETWSIAWSALPSGQSDRRHPRPLRTREQPWGMKDLTAKEFLQCETGSSLMGFTLQIMLAQAIQGVSPSWNIQKTL